MICKTCGTSLKEKWRYCPNCGKAVKDVEEFLSLEELIDRIKREIGDITKDFAKEIQILDFKDLTESIIKGGGFSIRISKEGDKSPEIDIKTFGDLEEEIKEMITNILNIDTKSKIEIRNPDKKKFRTTPEKVEEPEITFNSDGVYDIVTLDLPDVKDISQIDIEKFEESIEVRAFTDNKCYIKIIRIPKGTSIVKTEFSMGKLKLTLK
ncbi:MAG: zinc-ribbon domain-containing protein [Candidatus Hydrothermarchaeota archaeon]